jgi:transcriptional regulator with XRE-family HTH domain
MKIKLKAQVIREILNQKKKSQSWLATRIGITRGYMCQLMTGSRNPSPRMQLKILEVLKDYRPLDLFTLQGK